MGTVYFATMPITETIFFVCCAAGVWYWLDSLRAREIVIAAAERACAAEGCQLLDQTVVGRLPRLERDSAGRLQLRRLYVFEYTDTGDNRRAGHISLLGHSIDLLHVRPHLYIVPKSPSPDETLH